MPITLSSERLSPVNCVHRYWEVLGGIGMYWEVLGGIGSYWEVLGGIVDSLLCTH